MILQYIKREPLQRLNKPPLLILLHGVGSNEQDLFRWANDLPGSFLIISARAPFVMGANSYGWYQVDFSSGKPVINFDQAQKSNSLLINFIDQLVEEHQADPANVVLMGFSQGAIMSFTVALTHPEKVKGVVALSGRILHEFDQQISKKIERQQPAFFIGHGVNDMVLPVQHANESVVKLEALGLKPVLSIYNMPHSISNEEFSDVKQWLSALIEDSVHLK